MMASNPVMEAMLIELRALRAQAEVVLAEWVAGGFTQAEVVEPPSGGGEETAVLEELRELRVAVTTQLDEIRRAVDRVAEAVSVGAPGRSVRRDIGQLSAPSPVGMVSPPVREMSRRERLESGRARARQFAEDNFTFGRRS